MQRNGGSSRFDMDTLPPPSADGSRSPARRMTPRRRLIVCLLVPIACIVAFVVVSISRVESRFIYTRWFDDRRFGIEYSSEVSGDGTANRILNTSFYYPPALIVGIKQFRTPDSRTPTFRMVSNRQNTLHCVFDTLGWGYLAIVDTSTENCPFFCTSGTSHSAPDTLQWRSKFDELLKIHPSIPYVNAFDGAVSDVEQDVGEHLYVL